MNEDISTTIHNEPPIKLSTMHNSQIKNWLKDNRNATFYFSVKDFQSALSYWLIRQTETPRYNDMILAIKDYGEFITETLKIAKIEIINGIFRLDKEQLDFFTSANLFWTLQFIARFNESTSEDKGDFVDLSALSRNVFYMLLREKLTQGDYL